MIVFLVYSINTLGNNLVSSTGEQDSVLISYDDLRVATAKMVELDYTIEVNKVLTKIIYNDSIIIANQKSEITSLTNDNKKTKRQKRRIIIFSSIAGCALALLTIFK